MSDTPLAVPDNDKDSDVEDDLDVESIVGELVAEEVERATKREVDRIVSASFSFSGPLPTPQMIAGYERALQGLADRVVSMAEREQSHRHYLQKKDVDEHTARQRDGQRYGFALAVLFLIVSALLVLAGHPWPGTVIATIDIGALVAVFVTGKLVGRNDPVDKPRLRDGQRRDAESDEEEDS